MPEVVAGRRVAGALRAAARTLAKSGVGAPEREARLLWATVAGLHPAQVWRAREQPADPALERQFDGLVARRGAGEPLAYVAGSASFRLLELAVDHRVLIPRPETEGLVEAVLHWAGARFGRQTSWGAAADIGTGSGCIALSLAVEGRFSRVVATDVSAAALAVAARNVDLVAPPVAVALRQGALLAPLGDERFRAIVANLPYVADDEWDEVDRDVRDYEPAVALRGGPDGLDPLRAVLADAPRHIDRGGLVALELDSRRADAALEAARRHGWSAARVERDLFGRPRYLLAIWE